MLKSTENEIIVIGQVYRVKLSPYPMDWVFEVLLMFRRWGLHKWACHIVGHACTLVPTVFLRLSVFRHVSASHLQNDYCLNLAFDPRRKNDNFQLFHPGHTYKRQNALCLTKILFISFYGAPLSFSYFLLQGKVLCFACISKSLARCLLSKAFQRPCWKNYVSGYVWHKSFIQTVKCFLFNQIIVYQGVYGAPLT